MPALGRPPPPERLLRRLADRFLAQDVLAGRRCRPDDLQVHVVGRRDADGVDIRGQRRPAPVGRGASKPKLRAGRLGAGAVVSAQTTRCGSTPLSWKRSGIWRYARLWTAPIQPMPITPTPISAPWLCCLPLFQAQASAAMGSVPALKASRPAAGPAAIAGWTEAPRAARWPWRRRARPIGRGGPRAAGIVRWLARVQVSSDAVCAVAQDDGAGADRRPAPRRRPPEGCTHLLYGPGARRPRRRPGAAWCSPGCRPGLQHLCTHAMAHELVIDRPRRQPVPTCRRPSRTRAGRYHAPQGPQSRRG